MSARTSTAQTLEQRLLLTATLCLMAIGAVMVYSASSGRNVIAGDVAATTYLFKYLGYGAVGLLVLSLVSKMDLAVVRRLAPLGLAGAFLLLVLVLIPGVGLEINGAQRWLGVGPVQFQPSEVMKVALVLHVSGVVAARPKITSDVRLMFVPVLVVGGAAVLLVAAQPDLGTALVMSFTMAALLVACGAPLRQLFGIAAVGAVLVLLYAAIDAERMSRLTSFANPWAEAGGTGFQAVQGQIAIGSGGIFGAGLGQSVQKDLYLPEPHTDFILAVIGEELGVAGIGVILLLFGMIAFAGLRTAHTAKSIYAKLIAAGLTSLILCQALLNTWAVLGLAPLTGVPLPLISSGSTSMIVILTSVGLLINVAGGGSAHLRAVAPPRKRRDDEARRQAAESRDRSRRDGRSRGAGDSGRRRAAG